jgi:hypothetical protein
MRHAGGRARVETARKRSVRHFLAALPVAAILVAAGLGLLHAQNTGVVTPAPLPTPVLPLQAFNACMIGCSTQIVSCQTCCLTLSSAVNATAFPGATIASCSSAVGVTAIPSQCYLNCTSQQLLCQQTCPTR